MKETKLLLLLPLLLSCDSSADFLPQFISDEPAVVEIGELAVMSSEDWATYAGRNRPEWPDSASPSFDAQTAYDFCSEKVGTVDGVEGQVATPDGLQRCYYGEVGTGDLGVEGGATFTFKGTGGDVCLIVDPETVFWSPNLGEDGDPAYIYPDYTADDGDLDLFAGLSAYYNGSPGVEIGDFKGYYTDSLGRTIEIDYGECHMASSNSAYDTHSGLGSVEYCTVNTELHEGASYTVLLQTFSTPYDDGNLSFAAMAVAGNCEDVMVTVDPSAEGDPTAVVFGPLSECMLRGESMEDGELGYCTDKLERAYCLQELQQFCCLNPEMCSDSPPEYACPFEYLADPEDEESLVEYNPSERDAYCDANPMLCCDR